MCDFNLYFLVDALKEAFDLRKSRLALALREVGWEGCTACLNGENPQISNIVNDIVRSTSTRRKFDRQSYHILCDEADTIQESVNEWILLAAIKWHMGLHLVELDWRDGVGLLLQSIELLDMCHGIVQHVIWQQTEATKKEQATNGGKAKASLYAPLKSEMIRLLYCNKPSDGWKNMKEALESIDKDIYMFIQEHGYPGSPAEKKEDVAELFSRIPRLVEDWSRDDAVIKATFNATLKRKKKSAP